MQVTKLTSPADAAVSVEHQLSDKQLYDELNYHRAKKLTEKMLVDGLITSDECNKILAESRKIFVPILADIW